MNRAGPTARCGSGVLEDMSQDRAHVLPVPAESTGWMAQLPAEAMPRGAAGRIAAATITAMACLLPALNAAAGNVQRGAGLFRQCAACHSLQPGEHLTGPSLAGVFARKAGAAAGFQRYSDVLKKSGITWDERTLDGWLKSPAAFLPGNAMNFRGIGAARDRADLIAYLKAVGEGKAPASPAGGGMMAGPRLPSLKDAPPQGSVTAIRYCGDTYRVTTADGETHAIWEFNLRFKTDSGAKGPAPGKPALLQSGMMGDRAFIVFASPEELARTIQRECER